MFMITTQYKTTKIDKIEKNQAFREYVWNTRSGLVVLSTILFSSVLPMLFGRIGFAFATFATAGCVALLVGSALNLNLSKVQIFGLMLLTIIFMNIDAITSASEAQSSPRLSWILMGLCFLYVGISGKALVRCLERNVLVLLFTIFTIVQIIWSIQTDSISIMINVLQRRLFFLLVFVMTADLLTISRRTALGIFLLIFLAGISSAVMLGLEYYMSEKLALSRTILVSASGELRTAGLYINANAAAFVITFAAIALTWLTWVQVVPRGWTLACFPLLALGTLTTFSQKGMLMLAVAFGGLVLTLLSKFVRGYSFTKTIFYMTLAACVLMLIGNFLLIPQYINEWDIHRNSQQRLIRIGQMLSGRTEGFRDGLTSSGRSETSYHSWQAIQKSPWLGYGTGLSGMGWEMPEFQPHNLLLLIWVENGIFVLLFFCGLLAASIYNIAKSNRIERLYRFMLVVHLTIFILGAHTLLDNRYGAVVFAVMIVASKISLLLENNVDDLPTLEGDGRGLYRINAPTFRYR